MATNKARVDAQPVFILHQYPYRETSLLLDVFSKYHGRLTMMARGARRPGSQLRGVLMPFQPILMSWFGKGEVKTLHQAEWQGGIRLLSGIPLLCGYYVNELLMKLLPREDVASSLFSHYFTTISRLAKEKAVEPILREFELVLLQKLGYGFSLTTSYPDETPVLADKAYTFQSGLGMIPHYGSLPIISGQTLLDLSENDFHCEKTLQQSKQLLRMALSHELGGIPLRTRQILLDLHKI